MINFLMMMKIIFVNDIFVAANVYLFKKHIL